MINFNNRDEEKIFKLIIKRIIRLRIISIKLII